jgi:hypothetical protein
MFDGSNIKFVSNTFEFIDLNKYDIHDLIDQQANRVVGKIYIYKVTGQVEYIEFNNGKIKKMDDMFETGMDF